jgi:branched-chain amino acid transport system permease protein
MLIPACKSCWQLLLMLAPVPAAVSTSTCWRCRGFIFSRCSPSRWRPASTWCWASAACTSSTMRYFTGLAPMPLLFLLTKSGLPLWIGYAIAPFCSAALGLVLGLITVRLNRLYFGMLQISLGSLVWAITYRWYSFTGGDDGIHGIPLPDLVGSSTGAYYFNLIVAASCLLLMYTIVNSPFGRIFQGIRDNPERCQAVGVNVQKQQLTGQVLAAFFAGVAGTLFVTVEGSVFPDLMFWTLSLEILIMCLLGGWFIFLGPALGAAIIISLRTFAGIYTEYWTLILGIVLMLLIFFLPEGVLGLFLHKAGPAARRER